MIYKEKNVIKMLDKFIYNHNNPLYFFSDFNDLVNDNIEITNKEFAEVLKSLPHKEFSFYLHYPSRYFVIRELEKSLFILIFESNINDDFGNKNGNGVSVLNLTDFILEENEYVRMKGDTAFNWLTSDFEIDFKYESLNDLDTFNRIRDLALTSLVFFNRKLMNKECIVANQKQSFKIEKKNYKDINVTYVSNKKYLDNDIVKHPTLRTLDWHYSFIVRGHWRKTNDNTLGKDRNGERNQIGKTWVIEHMKNDELEFKSKLKIVK